MIDFHLNRLQDGSYHIITQLSYYFLFKMTVTMRKQPYYLSFHLPVTQNLVGNKMKIIQVSG